MTLDLCRTVIRREETEMTQTSRKEGPAELLCCLALQSASPRPAGPRDVLCLTHTMYCLNLNKLSTRQDQISCKNSDFCLLCGPIPAWQPSRGTLLERTHVSPGPLTALRSCLAHVHLMSTPVSPRSYPLILRTGRQKLGKIRGSPNGNQVS